MPEIRAAHPADATTIHTLAEAVWWPTYSPILEPGQIRYMLNKIYDLDTITRQITEQEQYYLILSENGIPQGFAAYSPRKENPEVFKLHKLYCLTETKGMGYGKKLLQAVEQKVLDAGKDVLELNVNKYNPAKTFYEKMGYEVIYEEDIPIGEYWMNDFVMRRALR